MMLRNSSVNSAYIYVYMVCQVANDKVATLKQEAEASERKIKHLVESFHTRLEVKGELSSADTLVLVNDHLKKRTCCRFICQDLQVLFSCCDVCLHIQ